MGRVLVVDPNYANTKSTVVELSGEYEEEVERAALLIESVLENQVRVAHRMGVRSKLDAEKNKIATEIELGLRCEFSVQQSLFGMVMGHKGSRVRAAQEQCAVQAIVVDKEALCIRIVGSDAKEVRKARAMLELRREVIRDLHDDKTRRILIGKGGKTIDDITRRSGAMSIDVDHDKGVVNILGTASATAAARILIESHISTIADMDAAQTDLETLRDEMHSLNAAWGEESYGDSYGGGYQGGYQGGGRGGRGGYQGRGGRGDGYQGRGERGDGYQGRGGGRGGYQGVQQSGYQGRDSRDLRGETRPAENATGSPSPSPFRGVNGPVSQGGRRGGRGGRNDAEGGRGGRGGRDNASPAPRGVSARYAHEKKEDEKKTNEPKKTQPAPSPKPKPAPARVDTKKETSGSEKKDASKTSDKKKPPSPATGAGQKTVPAPNTTAPTNALEQRPARPRRGRAGAADKAEGAAA